MNVKDCSRGSLHGRQTSRHDTDQTLPSHRSHFAFPNLRRSDWKLPFSTCEDARPPASWPRAPACKTPKSSAVPLKSRSEPPLECVWLLPISIRIGIREKGELLWQNGNAPGGGERGI